MRTLATIATMASLGVLTACGGSASDRPAIVDPPPAREVRVIDADTVDVDGVRYRLHGIDAPEARQSCRAWGRTWDCGAAATEALMSHAQDMTCAGSDTDAYGRTIGVCSGGGQDLNAWLVANGWALAYRRYSEDYVSEEEQARANRRGVHRGQFIEPWNWRRGERLEGQDTFAAITSAAIDADALAERMLHGDDAGVYGRWLEHIVFGMVDDAVAISFGDFPGTNPTAIGGATWTGTLIGIDTQSQERIDGNAAIEIDDFAHPDVDVAFSGITDAGGEDRADLHWEDIPLSQGSFEVRDTAGSIEGRFYGSDHGEAGGIFEQNHLMGAFGASR